MGDEVMFPTKAVANFFIDLGRAYKVHDLTPMKLQKLVYYAHGWHLAVTGKPLITEPVQAWPFGPVIPQLYHDCKEYDDSPVTRKLTSMELLPGTMKFRTFTPEIEGKSPEIDETKAILTKVWNTYSKFTSIQLSNMTHEAGTPWDQVNRQYGGQIPKKMVIDNDVIRQYFEKQAKK